MNNIGESGISKEALDEGRRKTWLLLVMIFENSDFKIHNIGFKFRE